MIVGVPTETYPDEQRVALVPGVVATLAKAGLDVMVEQGAGVKAGFPDSDYQDQGAQLATSRSQVLAEADVILQVRGLGANPDAGRVDLELVRSGQIIIGLLNPLGSPDAAQNLADKGVTSFALEMLPRISRAQPMDALSAMATVTGYKAVLTAAYTLPKMCPMLMTAAGTITPARVFIVGAGVAGLQAIATARRLGAVVQGYDVRPAVKNEVESLGAKFVELELDTQGAEGTGGYAQAMDEAFYLRQREMMQQIVSQSDIVITTAAVPGGKAPVLITEEMVQGMRPGSVIFDLAAEGGGNCELTQPGETVAAHGVTILGPTNVASTIPYHASQMYAKNLTAFLQNLVKEGELRLNLEDPIIANTLLTHQGEVVPQRVRELLGLPIAGTSNGERNDQEKGRS